MRDIKQLVIHCSATQDSLNIGFREINSWHRERGWLSESGVSCGYHYIIRRDGTVEIGRPERDEGAHVRGHNDDSLGICIIGLNDFDDQQLDELYDMCIRLCKKHKLDLTDDIKGHYEFEGVTKTCPNIDMVKFRAELIFIPDDDKCY